MNRIEALYDRLACERRAAFNAYLCAGDPDLDATRDLILAFDKAGVDALELGMPFSDPIADGPVIQAAGQRSLERGTTLPRVLGLVREVRSRRCEIPIALMTYYNIIHRFGVARFVREAVRAGVDGAVVPDLIPEEADELIACSRAAGLATVFFVAPTSTPERIALADRSSTGFIYCVSVTGITGARARLPAGLAAYVRRVRSATAKPVVVGFGVSSPEQVAALSRVADGVIVGSAIVREVERASALPRRELLRRVSRFVSRLAAAAHTTHTEARSKKT